jgi:hypothetical protein
MSTADVYRRRAASCILLAEESPQSASRLELMHMAQAWLRLAEQAEKNSETEIACAITRHARSRGGEAGRALWPRAPV